MRNAETKVSFTHLSLDFVKTLLGCDYDSDSETKPQLMPEPEKPVMNALDRRGDDSPASVRILREFLDSPHDLVLVR